jgi:uncharacterized protein (TIGR02246 family)
MAGDEGALEARLRQLEDLEAIRQLLIDYATCLDGGDHAGYADLFTEEGELHARLGQAKGRDAIRALLDDRLGGPRKTAFHLVGNPSITVERDRARSNALWAYITHDEQGHPIILQLGHYADELVREDGGWKFERRTISRDLGFSPLE